jgi:Tfp pilus assembly protein PilF
MAKKIVKTPPASRQPRATDLPTPPPAPKDTGEARLMLCVLFGLLGLALMGIFFFSDKEKGQFVYFLLGQTGLDVGDLFSSSIFWKLLIGFVMGSGAGLFVVNLVNPGDFELANKVSRYGAIFLITLLIYIPAMTASYIWDDDQEITNNQSLRSWAGLMDAWKGEKNSGADYFPLKTTMLFVEFQTFKGWDEWRGAKMIAARKDLEPLAVNTPENAEKRRAQLSQVLGHEPGLDWPGYHVVNILVHAIAAMLLVVALQGLGIRWAWLGGLLFAIHPVHVESVAWVSELKNTLSMVFYLLTFISYFKFERTNRWLFYGLALLAFVASLLCKTHVVVLPMALVLACWWKKGRLTLPDVLRSIPFFALSLYFGWLTIRFQHERAVGQEIIENFGGWDSRLAMAGMSTWWYLYKAICPDHLITIYPVWPIIPAQAYQYLFGIAMIGLLLALWFYSRSKNWVRACFFALAYFVATLIPVMGFIKMSYMRVTLVADHFQYISDISIIALGCAAAAMLYDRLRDLGRKVLVTAIFLLVFTFCGYTWNRAGTFQCEETLWTDTLSKNEKTWQAHNHMGAIEYTRREYKKAIIHFRRGVDLRPGNCEVQNNLGLAFSALGELDAALEHYAKAVDIKGDDSSIRMNYANGLAQAKRFDEAEFQYREAVKWAPVPAKPGVYFNLGNTLLQAGQFQKACDAYREALKISPGFQDAARYLEFAERQMAIQAQTGTTGTMAPPVPAKK